MTRRKQTPQPNRTRRANGGCLPSKGGCGETGEADFTSLASIVSAYKRINRPRRRAAMAWYTHNLTLAEAVERAVRSQREDGKCEHHQCLVGLPTLRRYWTAVKPHAQAIGAADSFNEIHDILWRCRIPRVGVLAVYDIATRIGAYRGLMPTDVYVHRGTRTGAKALGLPIREGRVRRADLPAEFQSLASDEVEDCLCIYKAHLARIGMGQA